MSEEAARVLWEGETALAVSKPAGMLVHNSSFAGARERSLRQNLGRDLARRVYPVHRLDRGTSGIVIFAREKELVAPWQEALARDDADKRYLAIVRGRLREDHAVDSPVKDPNGIERDARTDVRVLARSGRERVSLVELRLHTGRHHQARRHAAHLRHPIVNDATHGDSRFNRAFRDATGFERLALHCATIALTNPDEGTLLRLHDPLPDAFAALVKELFPSLDDSLLGPSTP